MHPISGFVELHLWITIMDGEGKNGLLNKIVLYAEAAEATAALLSPQTRAAISIAPLWRQSSQLLTDL